MIDDCVLSEKASVVLILIATLILRMLLVVGLVMGIRPSLLSWL